MTDIIKELKKADFDVDMVKATTLAEALPYIRRFHGSTVVVKYGGSAMLDEQLKINVIKDVALLKLIGMKPIIVHGGGKEINKWVRLTGKEPQFVNGLRVTDKETMEIAEMVLYKVNKGLVGMMEQVGVDAVGLCGKDSKMLKVEKKLAGDKDIGYVGKIVEVNRDLLDSLMKDDFIPVIAPIGVDEQGQTYGRKEKICIGQGYKGQSGAIGVGICTKGCACSLAGCPPKASDMVEFLKENWK